MFGSIFMSFSAIHWIVPGILFLVVFGFFNAKTLGKYRSIKKEESCSGNKIMAFIKIHATNAHAFVGSVHPGYFAAAAGIDLGLCLTYYFIYLKKESVTPGWSFAAFVVVTALIVLTIVMTWRRTVRLFALVLSGTMIWLLSGVLEALKANASWFFRTETGIKAIDFFGIFPAVLFWIGIGIIFARFFYKKSGTVDGNPKIDQDYKKFWRRFYVWAAVGVCVVVLFILGDMGKDFFDLSWESVPASANDGGQMNQQEENTTPATTTPATTTATTAANADEATADSALAAEAEPWYKFRNLELQDDEIDGNDWNVGPDPTLSLTKEEKEELAADPDGFWHKKLKERGDEDLLVRALVMAWEDVSLGTGLLDSLTDELNGWSAVNPFDQVDKAIKVFAADKELCDKYWNKALEILDSADKSEVVKAEKLHYLVYISPGKNTIDGKPEVAILETEGKMEDCIVYTFIRDGKKVDLAFSINDGFRPCVVDKIYVAPTPSKTTPTPTPPVEKTTPPVKTTKVTPSPTPKKTDTTVTNYTPTTTYNPVPTSTPTVPVPKDPARSPDFSKINPEAGGDRDDHGPGEMTIGDSDTWSTKENPDDSVHKTYPEYKEKIEKVEKAEPEVAKSPTASEPTPTPAPVPGTPPVDRVDNNEKEIDKKTEGDPLVVKADGKEIDNSKPVTKTWGGLKGNED